MEEFPGNSQIVRKPEAEKEEPKAEKLEKMVTGKVVRRKKPLGRKFSEVFFSGASSVWEYVLHEVLIPAAKDTAVDMVTQAIERAMHGEGSGRRRTGPRASGPSGYVSYNRFAQTPRREEPRALSRRARATHDFAEIILDSRAEAESVLDKLFDLVTKYGQVTVSDVYDLVGVRSTFTDERWGWRDIQGSRIQRISGGQYLLDLPKTESLD